MDFPLPIGTAPMEAKSVAALPSGPGWQFEPKWDGFRCLAFRAGDDVELMSKSGKPLSRFFPEVVEKLRALASARFVIDGELTVASNGVPSFDALQARLHPAASRIARLARETPAQWIVFDCLFAPDGRNLLAVPFGERREALEALVEREGTLRFSPRTFDTATAEGWLAQPSAAIDGVVAKRLADAYRSGERAMLKVKRHHSADCVVGGFRYATDSNAIGSLLLGLYNDAGDLDHVGFVAGLPPEVRSGLRPRLEALVAPPGFTGKAPGGSGRWSTERSAEWQPLKPELVVEVSYDQVTGDRFRHAAGFIRWRSDKAPSQCGMDQLARPVVFDPPAAA